MLANLLIYINCKILRNLGKNLRNLPRFMITHRQWRLGDRTRVLSANLGTKQSLSMLQQQTQHKWKSLETQNKKLCEKYYLQWVTISKSVSLNHNMVFQFVGKKLNWKLIQCWFHPWHIRNTKSRRALRIWQVNSRRLRWRPNKWVCLMSKLEIRNEKANLFLRQGWEMMRGSANCVTVMVNKCIHAYILCL